MITGKYTKQAFHDFAECRGVRNISTAYEHPPPHKKKTKKKKKEWQIWYVDILLVTFYSCPLDVLYGGNDDNVVGLDWTEVCFLVLILVLYLIIATLTLFPFFLVRSWTRLSVFQEVLELLVMGDPEKVSTAIVLLYVFVSSLILIEYMCLTF